MSASTRARLLSLTAAGVCLLAAGRTPAQAPPPAPDVEQRLRAVEDKMDRVLKLLEARDGRAAPASSEAAVKTVRDRLRADLEAREKAYREFQQRNPFTTPKSPGQGGARHVLGERLATIEVRRVSLTFKKQELEGQIAQIEKRYKEGGKAAALAVIEALGVKPGASADRAKLEEQLRKYKQLNKDLVDVLGTNHPAVKEVGAMMAETERAYKVLSDVANTRPAADNLGAFIAALKEEVKLLDDQIESLNDMFDRESQKARELSKYEVEGQKLRDEIARLRQMIAGVDAVLRGDAPPAK